MTDEKKTPLVGPAPRLGEAELPALAEQMIKNRSDPDVAKGADAAKAEFEERLKKVASTIGRKK